MINSISLKHWSIKLIFYKRSKYQQKLQKHMELQGLIVKYKDIPALSQMYAYYRNLAQTE